MGTTAVSSTVVIGYKVPDHRWFSEIKNYFLVQNTIKKGMEVSIKMNLYVKVSFSFGLCVSIADCSTVQYYLHMIWRIIFFSLCTYVSFTRKSFCLPDENELTFELFRVCTRSTGHYLSPFATAWSDNGQPEVVYFRSRQFPPPFLKEQHCCNCPLLALLTVWPLFLGHRLHYRVA